jgi:hypothetical protein
MFHSYIISFQDKSNSNNKGRVAVYAVSAHDAMFLFNNNDQVCTNGHRLAGNLCIITAIVPDGRSLVPMPID